MDVRSIDRKMIDWLDKQLALNGLAQKAMKDKDATMLMRLAAQACVGIREKGGNNRGPMVELIQDTIGGRDPWAWCMSFVQTCIAYAEVKTDRDSAIYPHEHCMTVWVKTPRTARILKTPAPGSIVIWQHGNTQAGHTGIVEAVVDDGFTAFEGNTTSGLGEGDKVIRDGGGVYYTKRRLKAVGDMNIVGFLRPFP